MSQFDNEVAAFRDSMEKSALYVHGGENTDVITDAGPIPTLAKQAKHARDTIAGLTPDISNRLSMSDEFDYGAPGRAIGRANLGLNDIDNTSDADKPVSTAVQAAIEQLILDIQARESPGNRNQPDGYVGLMGLRVALRNNANTYTSLLQNDASAVRTWTLPDETGEIALKSDIKGNNSGTNTGDETTSRVLGLLGIDAISGINTGDETVDTIKNKLGIEFLSGANTGDETNETIIAKIGYDVMPLGARNANNGVAPLDENRLVPVDNLPPMFESVVMYEDVGELPTEGVEKRIYITRANSGMYFWNSVFYVDLKTAINNTDQLAEGQDNLYFKVERVLLTALVGLDLNATGAVEAADTVLQAIGKLRSDVATRELAVNKATDFSVTNNVLYPTTQAVATYVDTRMVGMMNDRGTYAVTEGTTDWPTTGGSAPDGSIRKGDMWFVKFSTSNDALPPPKLGGAVVNTGDSFRALSDNPDQDASKWSVLESNIGYVPLNAALGNQADGYVKMTFNRKIPVVLANGATGARLSTLSTGTAYDINFPAASGTVALLTDITGTNSGVNTGDETGAGLVAKLAGLSLALSGLSVSPTALATGVAAGITLVAQSVDPAASQVGGGVVITAGNAATNTTASRAGGNVIITAGNGAGNGTTGPAAPARGGNISIKAGQGGQGTGQAVPGVINIIGADGGVTTGSGGVVNIQGGNAQAATGSGGSVILNGGYGGLNNLGGVVQISGGSGGVGGGGVTVSTLDFANTTGNSGPVDIKTGNVIQTTNAAAAGNVTITAGSHSGTSGGNGGNVNITAGNAVAGAKGSVNIYGPGGILLDSPTKCNGGMAVQQANKGSVASGTVTFDVTRSSEQKLTVTGPLTIATSGWQAGYMSDLRIQLVNGGSGAVTFTNIKWILPSTGAPAASFAAYLTAINRSGLQTSGTDWIYLWSSDDGVTINGKLM